MLLNSKINRILFLLIVFSSIYFIIKNSIVRIGAKDYILFEAEDADEINYPLKVIEVDNNEVSNRKIIVTGGTTDVHRVATGYAIYNLNLKNSGKYFVWARCYWPNACANSFSLSVNQMARISFGGDGIMNTWHWVFGAEFDLKQGKNKLLLWNSEMNSEVDKFVITTDNDFRPSGLGESSEMIIDFDSNVLPSDIKYDRNYWSIANDTEYNRALYCMPITNKIPQKILLNEGSSLRYIFMASVKFKRSLNRSSTAQLYFNYLNEDNFYTLNFNENNIELLKIENGKQINIDRCDIKNINYNTYYDFMIIKEDSITKVKFCGKTFFRIKNKSNEIGKIGNGGKLGIGSTSGDIYFDNIMRLANDGFSYSQNFHFKIIFPTYKKPETIFNYSEIYKVGGFHYWILDGNWRGFWPFQLTNNYSYAESLCGKRDHGKDALLTIGQYFWSNYSFTCCLKTSNRCSAGLCFYYQDEKNYYLVKLDDTKGNTIVQLLAIKDGIERILAVKDLPLTNINDWIKVEIRTLNARKMILLDEQLIFDLSDNSFYDGKVGFWNRADQYVSYDDIEVMSIKSLNSTSSNIYNYSFNYAMQYAKDIADWKLKNADIQPYSYIEKNIFSESFITHKKQFKGDIMIKSFVEEIPNDVGVFYRLTSIGGQSKKEFTCRFNKDSLAIMENNEVLVSKKIHNIRWGAINFQLSKKNNTWELYLNNNSLLVSNGHELNDYQLSVGFYGIGKGRILLKNIQINN